MGEIKIKSGNLALWDKQWLINVSGVVEYDKNVWASIIDVRDINTIYLSGDVTKLNNSIYRIGRFTEYPELGVVGIRSTSLGGVLDVTNYNFCLVSCSLFSMPTTRQDLVDEFMITLGSTPPTEFQPYFLNRPAHQFISGEWIDIPTHHFINGIWQGELTSQSPLKFRADGTMLDWRIEGKTSGNLFDTSVYNNDTYRHNCTVSNTSNSVTITSTGTDPYSGDVFTARTTIPAVARTMYMPVKPNTAYTIAMSSAPKCYITQIDAEHNSVSGFRITQNLFTFTTDSATRYIIIRLGDDTLQVGESRTFENTQLVEGTYTTSTIPPYEPYGGVGDWDETAQKYRIPVTVNGATTTLYTDHQLMDGDAIDFATDQTTIPLVTGNNTLTVDTAVQPSKVFIKFEG